MSRFRGVDVMRGAGIGRYEKDALLMRLLQEMGLAPSPDHIWPMRIHYAPPVVDFVRPRNPRDFIESCMDRLRGHVSATSATPQTFREFAVDILGQKDYDAFLVVAGISDFEDADAQVTLKDYGLDDVFVTQNEGKGEVGRRTGGGQYSQKRHFSVPWKEMVRRMARNKSVDIVLGAEVVNISRSPSSMTHANTDTGTNSPVWKVTYSRDDASIDRNDRKGKNRKKKQDVCARRVVIAGTACTLRTLLSCDAASRSLVSAADRGAMTSKSSLSSCAVRGQSFVRVYAQFDVTHPAYETFSSSSVPCTTIVHNSLQRIIPISPRLGIYMIAYCDNHHAEFLRDKKSSTFYEMMIAEALGVGIDHVPPIKGRVLHTYWENGTHYYPPLPPSFSRGPPMVVVRGDDERKYGQEEFLYRAQRPAPGVWVVGEAIARHQGWTEGALESVEQVIHEISAYSSSSSAAAVDKNK